MDSGQSSRSMRKRYQQRREQRREQVMACLAAVETRLADLCGAGLMDRLLDDVHMRAEGEGCVEAIAVASPLVDVSLEYAFMESIPPAIHPSAGELLELRSQRKVQQVGSVVSRALLEVERLLRTRDSVTVVDFGAGSGHVGLALAYLCPSATVYLCERKEYSLQVAQRRIQDSGLSNVRLFSDSLSGLQTRFDLGVSLHSCGRLTDLALRLCARSEASFVLVPCCYGQLAKPDFQHVDLTLPAYLSAHRSEHLSTGLLGALSPEVLGLLSSAADTSVDSFDDIRVLLDPHADPGSDYLVAKRCMRLIDLDRAMRMCEEQPRYRCEVSSLWPVDCSPKNGVLSGRIHDERI